MTYADKAGAKITPLLDAGETLVAAARFQSKGKSSAMAVGGLAGAAINAARSSGDKKAAAAAGVTLPGRGVLVVTDRRVLILNQTAWLGRPKKVASEFPAASVSHAELTGKGIAPALKRMKITFATGGASDIDLIGRDGADEIVRALNTGR